MAIFFIFDRLAGWLLYTTQLILETHKHAKQKKVFQQCFLPNFSDVTETGQGTQDSWVGKHCRACLIPSPYFNEETKDQESRPRS